MGDEFGKKKKKKKSKDDDAADDTGDGGDADFGKKKKKKKKKGGDDDDEGEGGDDDDEDGEGEDGAGEGAATKTGSGLPWDGSNRDYHYDELLGRVFGILREKNPALSEKTKTIIKPPQVLREGTKKTVFVNLMEICNAMHRHHDHVLQYLMAELGTSGTLDGQQRLILKGRFLPKVHHGRGYTMGIMGGGTLWANGHILKHELCTWAIRAPPRPCLLHCITKPCTPELQSLNTLHPTLDCLYTIQYLTAIPYTMNHVLFGLHHIYTLIPYILYPIPYTLYPIPYTLHLTAFTPFGTLLRYPTP